MNVILKTKYFRNLLYVNTHKNINQQKIIIKRQYYPYIKTLKDNKKEEKDNHNPFIFVLWFCIFVMVITGEQNKKKRRNKEIEKINNEEGNGFPV